MQNGKFYELKKEKKQQTKILFAKCYTARTQMKQNYFKQGFYMGFMLLNVQFAGVEF